MQSVVNSRKIALWTATIVLVLLGFFLLWQIRSVLFLLFLSILLATGIEPIVNRLRKGVFNRSAGILVVYSFMMLLVGLILYLSLPPLFEEANRLLTTFTNRDQAEAAIAQIDNGFLKSVANQAYTAFSDISRNFKINGEALSVGLTLLEVLFSFITVFVIAYYWLTERTLIKRFVFSLVPEHKRPGARQFWHNVEKKLGAWTRGQLVLMLFIGVLTGVGYWIMGVKYALVLAVFAALTELIPLVGPYIGGAPAVLVALTQSVWLALIVAIYIAVIQLIEGNILVPRIMNSAVGVTPLTVILGILIGSTLAGIPGALLAVPIAATIQVGFEALAATDEENTDGLIASPEPIPAVQTTNVSEQTPSADVPKFTKAASPE